MKRLGQSKVEYQKWISSINKVMEKWKNEMDFDKNPSKKMSALLSKKCWAKYKEKIIFFSIDQSTFSIKVSIFDKFL